LPNGNDRSRRPLSQHNRHVHVQVDVLDLQTDQLGASDARVDHQAKDRGIAYLEEPAAACRLQKRAHLVLGQHGHGLLRHPRWPDVLHRMRVDLALLDQVAEESVQRPVPLVDRRGGQALPPTR
jgi:hypothetical protein